MLPYVCIDLVVCHLSYLQNPPQTSSSTTPPASTLTYVDLGTAHLKTSLTGFPTSPSLVNTNRRAEACSSFQLVLHSTTQRPERETAALSSSERSAPPYEKCLPHSRLCSFVLTPGLPKVAKVSETPSQSLAQCWPAEATSRHWEIPCISSCGGVHTVHMQICNACP